MRQSFDAPLVAPSFSEGLAAFVSWRSRELKFRYVPRLLSSKHVPARHPAGSLSCLNTESRRSARSRPAADVPQAAPALASGVASRRARALARVRLHDDLDHDSAAHAACGRPRDRRAYEAVVAVHRRHRRSRDRPLSRQLLAPLRDCAHRHPHRGTHARASLHRVPALPARVLRPASDRPGAVARDERPLPHPLLHRLGSRAGDAEPDDDRVGGDRARDRESAARALHRRVDATDHRARAPLRAPRLAALAQGAGAQGRRDGGGRRVRRRNRDGAGVRTRGGRAGTLRRQGRSRPRHRARAGGSRSAAPARALLPAGAFDRGRRLLRRIGR